MKTSLNEFLKTGQKRTIVPPKENPSEKRRNERIRKQLAPLNSDTSFNLAKKAPKKKNRVSNEPATGKSAEQQPAVDLHVTKGASSPVQQQLTQIETFNESTA